MNIVILSGNLATEPEIGKTTGGLTVCSFRLAVRKERKVKDGEPDADFITIVTWNKLAELCAKYLSKGKKALVFGTMEPRSYQDKDGAKRTVTEVIASKVEFLSPKENGADDSQPTGGGYPPLPSIWK